MVTVGSSGAAASAPSTKTPPPPPPPSPTSAPAPTTGTGRATTAPTTAQQPPAKGMVWVNLDTKVFHREGDRYYGKTKHGKFMTEAEAVQAGYREAKSGGRKSKG